MTRDAGYIADIIEAIDRVEDVASRGRETFDADHAVQAALLHYIQIIGEAASALSDQMRGEHPDVPWRNIIAMRNRIVHGYFDVDLELVWTTATVHLPRLRDQLVR